MPSRTDANGETVLVHYLDLNEYGLGDVPSNLRAEVKREVADFLRDEVLRNMSNGTSPVNGEGRFRRLSEDYSKNEKSGNKLSDLELEGDLKDSLIVEPDVTSFLAIGHRGGQVPKADGHNQLSGKAESWARENNFPKRRYIPDSNQEFTRPIVNGITEIIKEYKRPVTDRPENSSTGEPVDRIRSTTTSSNNSVFNFFNDTVIDQLLRDAINRRR